MYLCSTIRVPLGGHTASICGPCGRNAHPATCTRKNWCAFDAGIGDHESLGQLVRLFAERQDRSHSLGKAPRHLVDPLPPTHGAPSPFLWAYVLLLAAGERESPGAAGSRVRLDLGPAVLQRAPQPRVHRGRLPPAAGETTAPRARVLPLSAGKRASFLVVAGSERRWLPPLLLLLPPTPWRSLSLFALRVSALLCASGLLCMMRGTSLHLLFRGMGSLLPHHVCSAGRIAVGQTSGGRGGRPCRQSCPCGRTLPPCL